MADKDLSYLVQKESGLYYITLVIPKEFRKKFPYPILSRSLQTRDIDVAVEKGKKLLKVFEELLGVIRKRPTIGMDEVRDLIKEMIPASKTRVRASGRPRGSGSNSAAAAEKSATDARLQQEIDEIKNYVIDEAMKKLALE